MTYQGNWIENQMHGKGKLIWTDGRTYDGFFKLDQKHGYGEYRLADNSVYKGEFSNNQYHGKGTFISKNIEIYGVWSDGTLIKQESALNS